MLLCLFKAVVLGHGHKDKDTEKAEKAEYIVHGHKEVKMKRTGIQNGELIKILATIGHTQTLVISDVGLPVPKGVQCIDLALIAGIPSFVDVLDAVCNEFVFEAGILAEELKEVNVEMYRFLEEKFSDIPLSFVPHETLKALSEDSMVIIRTGETRSYCNIILQAGVNF